MPQLEDGAINVFPEYTGNLLQFFKDDTKARASDEVYKELETELPDSLAVLEQANASDQDSYTVTRKFADENKLKSIEDLAGVSTKLTLGGPRNLLNVHTVPRGLKASTESLLTSPEQATPQ